MTTTPGIRSITWSTPGVAETFGEVRTRSPFVYGLTNYVAANLSANVLLAVGAGPAIGAAAGWSTTFPAGAGAMWINAAAMISNPAEPLAEAAAAAQAAGTPWVLDPVAVGAGAGSYDAIVRSLLSFRPAIIRGNASELIALAGGAVVGKGVDTTADSADAVEFIQELARSTGAVVAASGATDYITDGDTTVAIPGGDVQMTMVTGTGCSLGALCAGMLAVTDDPLQAASVAHAAYAVAAERAASRTSGIGEFAVAMLDELSTL